MYWSFHRNPKQDSDDVYMVRFHNDDGEAREDTY